jgi:hypothetical protein
MPKVLAIIAPKSIIDERKVKMAITNTLRGAAKSIKVDFIATTMTWSKRPSFVTVQPSESVVAVGTDNPIWGMINAGTKPHIIRVKNAKWLRFQWDGKGSSRAKTIPRQFRSNKGKSGKRWNFRKSVNHPGFPAREYDSAAIEKYEQIIPTIMSRAIASANTMK